jgi:hypothetical protein
MCFEDIYITKCRIVHTRDGTSVVNQLSDVVTALSHLREPLSRNRAQLIRLSIQPDVDGGISLYGL